MPLFWLSVALIGGIGLARILALDMQAWLVLGGCCVLLAEVAWLRKLQGKNNWPVWSHLRLFGLRLDWLKPPLPYPLLLAAVCLGAARYAAQHPPLDPTRLAWYNDRAMEWVLQGVLAAPPDERDSYTNLYVRVERLSSIDAPGFRTISGLLLAQVTPGEEWHYGDRLSLRGELVTPPEGDPFSYRDYLAVQGVYSLLRRAKVERLEGGPGNSLAALLYRLNAAGLALAYRLYPDPEASLVAGILLGVDRGMPERVQQAFSDSGTAHIVAISGFNITLLAGVLASLSSRMFGRWRGAILAGIGIALYTALTGGQPSAVRSAWMGGLGLLAAQIGRRQDGLNSLGLTAAVMAWLDSNVLQDIGFQLSFTATLGLILLGNPFTDWTKGMFEKRLPAEWAKRLSQPLVEYFMLTLAAQALSLPVTIYHFQRLSIAGLAANFFVLPVQPLLMILGGLSLLAGLALVPLGQFLAYLAWPFAHFTILAAELFGALPGAVLATGKISGWIVLGFYALAVAAYLGRGQLKTRLGELKKIWQPGLALFLLSAVAVLAWQSARGRPDGRLHITLLDVSAGAQSGEAVLIQTTGGRFGLVNGGPSATRLSDALGQRLPTFERRLDYLVVAGVEDAQLQALPTVMERYPVDQALWAGEVAASNASRQLNARLIEMNVSVEAALPGQALDLGEEARLEVLYAGPRGATLLLSWKNFRMLLPMGLDAAALDEIGDGREIGQLSALLLPASGYAPLNPAEWAQNMRPQVVLLSVSAKDSGGLPGAKTLSAWQDYSLLRTDLNGWIEIETDGEQMWVQVENK